MKDNLIKLFLRLSIAVSFLSAVADRFGYWPKTASVWGNWENFVKYTGQLLHFLPDKLVNLSAVISTALELILGVLLIVGYKVRWTALASGILLLAFALSMIIALGIKAPLDYSVFTSAAAAFALSRMRSKYLEIS